jgi:arginine/lysine/ornithine decarboxylase
MLGVTIVNLQDKLNNLDKYPFHMPGHKRNEKFGIIGSNIDVTEIEGLDNLHDAKDVLLDVENKLSKIYKSKKSFMLVNGSTVGILSAIFAVCKRGDKIIVARNCHKSVYNACMLLELRVVYIEPNFDYVNGYYTRVEQTVVDKAILNNPDACAVVITSPTYEGNLSHISCDIPLIVDSAHGAHLGLSYFPAYPTGDIVISSLHKTLPALTQTAVMNVYNEAFIKSAKLYLDMFESSSPSYVLMNSVCICADYVLNNKDDFDDYYSNLTDFRCNDFFALRLIYTDDPSKIVISTANTNMSGIELAQALREYEIEHEMASLNYVILMTSVGDTKEAFDKLLYALKSIDQALLQCAQATCIKPPVPSGVNMISLSKDTTETALNDVAGRISAEFVYAYPPDIPIIAPNETITPDTVKYLKNAIKIGVNIVSDSGLLPNKILTKCDI